MITGGFKVQQTKVHTAAENLIEVLEEQLLQDNWDNVDIVEAVDDLRIALKAKQVTLYATELAEVELDGRYNIMIDRQGGNDMDIRVYPITNGEVWDAPYATFTVEESEVEELEKELN